MLELLLVLVLEQPLVLKIQVLVYQESLFLLYPFDLSDLDNIDDLSNSVQEEVGDIDILIKNAGICAWS